MAKEKLYYYMVVGDLNAFECTFTTNTFRNRKIKSSHKLIHFFESHHFAESAVSDRPFSVNQVSKWLNLC